MKAFQSVLIAAVLLAGTASLPLHQAATAQATPLPVAPTPVARMDHISIAVSGRGSPVILIPGLSSPRAVWDGVVPALARDHRVYVVQVNGFGGDAPGRNLEPGILDGIVADLHALIAREGMAGVPIVGHSMGGLVALMLAKAHPADAGRVMVVDALPFIGTLFAPTATVATVEPQARAMRDAQVASYGKPADPAAAAAIAERLALKPASRALVTRWAMATDPRVSGQAMYEDMTTDLRPDLAGIATPVTMVFPFSAALPEARATPVYHAAYAGTPRIRFVPVGDAGHFVMLDQPERFQAALEAFLRG